MAAATAQARWVTGFVDAWVGQDVDALDALFTEDLVMYWNPAAEPLVGLPALKDYWVAEGDLQSDIRVSWPEPLVAGTTVIAELWVRMSYKGGEASDPDAIAQAHEANAVETADGRPVVGQLCVIAELDADGRCSLLRQYQLGGDGDAEPPEWWGSNHAASITHPLDHEEHA